MNRLFRAVAAAWQRAQAAPPPPIPLPPGLPKLPASLSELPVGRVVALVHSVLTEMATRDGISRSHAADVIMVAISGQEAAWIHRDQVVTGKLPGAIGPATGLWQFERGGGVAGVLRHQASAAIALRWCRAEGVDASPDAVWRALVANDRLACVFARLLLLTDPRRLPDDQDAAWDYYLHNWRPGKPHQKTWARNWTTTKTALT